MQSLISSKKEALFGHISINPNINFVLSLQKTKMENKILDREYLPVLFI